MFGFYQQIGKTGICWAAIGQIVGAIATVWAVIVALKQTKLAIKQMEEARIREKEALKPELTIKVRLDMKGNIVFIGIFLTNIKQIPAYILKYELNYRINDGDEIIEYAASRIESKKIKTEVPEIVSFGDVCITEIPIDLLVKYLKELNEPKGLFECLFYLATGEICTVSILLDYNTIPQIPLEAITNGLANDVRIWNLYACPKRVQSINEIRIGENRFAGYSSMFSRYYAE